MAGKKRKTYDTWFTMKGEGCSLISLATGEYQLIDEDGRVVRTFNRDEFGTALLALEGYGCGFATLATATHGAFRASQCVN